MINTLMSTSQWAVFFLYYYVFEMGIQFWNMHLIVLSDNDILVYT